MIATVPEKVVESMRERTPLRRLGRAEDIANAYLFLASDEASFITGSHLMVHGLQVEGLQRSVPVDRIDGPLQHPLHALLQPLHLLKQQKNKFKNK